MVDEDLSSIAQGLLNNPLATAIGGAVVGAAVTGTAIGITAAVKKKRRKASSKSSKKTRSRKKRNYKYARTAGKGKDRSTRRIRMTKNGQPYVITSSGKARFISKRSARLSRKRKGGRY